jgi:hypothetical protein
LDSQHSGGRARSAGNRRLRSLPPLDPTNPPTLSRIPVARPSSISGLRPIAKPILASECLRDDIAPLEPFALGGRLAFAVSGVGLGAIAGMLRSPLLGAAAVVAAISVALPRYTWRAAGAALSAVVAMSAFAAAPSVLLRVVAATILASALFLRATYRAHTATRIAIGVGLAVFVASALDTGRISGIAIGVAASASLLGFMNDQTTGGCAWWGGLAMGVSAASIALTTHNYPLAAAALLTLIAGALGAYHLASSIIAPAERSREHRASLPPASNDTE